MLGENKIRREGGPIGDPTDLSPKSLGVPIDLNSRRGAGLDQGFQLGWDVDSRIGWPIGQEHTHHGTSRRALTQLEGQRIDRAASGRANLQAIQTNLEIHQGSLRCGHCAPGLIDLLAPGSLEQLLELGCCRISIG